MRAAGPPHHPRACSPVRWFWKTLGSQGVCISISPAEHSHHCQRGTLCACASCTRVCPCESTRWMVVCVHMLCAYMCIHMCMCVHICCVCLCKHVCACVGVCVCTCLCVPVRQASLSRRLLSAVGGRVQQPPADPARPGAGAAAAVPGPAAGGGLRQGAQAAGHLPEERAAQHLLRPDQKCYFQRRPAARGR